MGKYIVTSGSHFEPFSYDDLVKPLQQMTDVWNQTQDAYDVMNLDSSMLDQFINKEADPMARQKYDSYMNKLQTLQEDLWANGINARTRKYLTEARNGYAKDIKSLQTAIQNRNERSKAYWDTYHKNPDMVMGIDPGKASLDKYLEDTNYGSDWFSYSGKQFMSEVAAEAQARAKEYESQTYSKEVPGFITRISREGFSNDDVNSAVDAVRNGTVGSLEGAPRILADVLVGKMNATGAQVGVNISPEQYNRFIDYGATGLSAGVGDKNYKDLEDVIFKQRLSDSSWAWRNSVTRRQALEDAEREHQNKLELEKIKNGGSVTPTEDTLTIKGAGENYEKARKQVRQDIGGDFTQMVFTKSGKKLKNNAQASSLVYGEDIRRKAYPVLGWDIGTTKEKYMQGKGSYNGNEYYTKYYDGKILISDDGQHWGISKELTKFYNNKKKAYDDNLNYYKTKEKDIYKLALTDPDEQRKMYEREGIDFGSTALGDYASVIMNRPENKKEVVWTSAKTATRGTDNGNYIGVVADHIYSNLEKKKKGGDVKNRQTDWRSHTGLGSYLHELSGTGQISMKPVANPNDVFDIDKDKGTITNIDQIRVDSNGLKNGYIIVHLSNKNKEYAVGLDLLGSDDINAIFENYAEMISDDLKYYPNMSIAERRSRENDIVSAASKSIKTAFGWKEGTVGGPTSNKEDIN